MEHFQNRDALGHVVEKKVAGFLSLSESHGTEMPGHFSSGADALRETSLFLFLAWLILFLVGAPSLTVLAAVSVALIAWKTGRSAWLGWARLERLHRVMEQEKFEIENHRDQEREELKALYRAKGFEGQLLEDVMDVLMADNDRLLKVMLEEELGLTLQAYEHPLKQCLGALLGSLVAVLLLSAAFLFLPVIGIYATALLLVGGGAAASALYEKNEVIPAIVWNLAIAGLSVGAAFFIFRLLS
ncbi:MAG: VIT1/CCC1 transporter family protein [Chlamydiales bacterium]|nr:VIT1/CCC1 transporter family protein [Chlamydiales bacterium]